MTKDWELKNLDEICTIARGGSPRPISSFLTDSEDGINWIKIGDVPEGSKYLISTKQKIKKEGAKRSRKVFPGDFLLSNSMSFGRPYISKIEGCIHDGWLVLSLDKNLIDSDFLYYFLSSQNAYAQLDRMAQGSTVRNINIEIAKKLEVYLPKSIKQQRQIVDILDDKFKTLEKLKDVAESQLSAAQELFVSRSEELLTNSNKWEEKTIDDVCLLENGDRGKNYPSNAKLHMEGIPFVSAGNLQEQGITLSGRNYLSDRQYSLLRGGKFTSGDILFCLRGSLGKYAYVKSIDRGAIASSLVIVRPKDVVSREYIMSYFGSGLCKKMIEKYAGGAAQPNLGAKDLKKFSIFLPTLKEQKVICDELATLKKQTKELEQVFRRKIADIEELKKSYLNEAFSGKL